MPGAAKIIPHLAPYCILRFTRHSLAPWRTKCNGLVMLRKHALPALAVSGILATCLPAILSAQTQPDNTAANKQDRSDTAVTAGSQKENHNDRYLTQQIRKAVIADKSLSTYAHNVKIVSQDGTVTLKGPVRSDDERKSILAKAEQIAGQGKVTDQLSVKEAQ
jgi:hyperosmotically inducible protein